MSKLQQAEWAYIPLLLVLGSWTAQAGEASLAVGAGLSSAPAYQGAQKNLLWPIFQITAGYESEQWGELSVGMDGLRWQLAPQSAFNLALLAGYETGRKEDEQSLGRHDNSLQGMGKLSGSLTAGMELGLNFDAYRLYLKGMQAMKARDYGGEGLGRTFSLELGIDANQALSNRLSLGYGLSTTWANSGYQRGYFGVTEKQAQNSKFSAYRPNSGLQQMAAKTSLTYGFTPELSLTTGIMVSRLLGDAADSPLTAKKVTLSGFTLMSYQF